jgi:glycogen synthase
VQRAIGLYRSRVSWRRVMRLAMSQDVSWVSEARQDLALYREFVGVPS